MIRHRNTMPQRTAAGGSGQTAALIGVLNVNTTSQATTGTVEEVLATYTLPANTLNANGKTVRITAAFALAANANVKTVSLRLGGLAGTILATHTSSSSNIGVNLVGETTRTGANAQLNTGSVWQSGGLTITLPLTSALTDTGAIDIVATGTTATAAGDATFKKMVVEILN